jgi:hypothetical protein
MMGSGVRISLAAPLNLQEKLHFIGYPIAGRWRKFVRGPRADPPELNRLCEIRRPILHDRGPSAADRADRRAFHHHGAGAPQMLNEATRADLRHDLIRVVRPLATVGVQREGERGKACRRAGGIQAPRPFAGLLGQNRALDPLGGTLRRSDLSG